MAEENGQEEQQAEQTEQEKKPKNKLVLILSIVSVILLGVVSFLGYSFLNQEDSELTEEMQEEQQVEKKYQDNGEEISLSEAYIHSLDEFVSNIASEDGSSSNFIKLKIDLVFNQSEVSEEILSKFNSYFSDIVLTTVSEKNFEFLNTYSGKNELKIELKEKFNQLFSQIEDDIEIKKILFKSFVIQ